MTSVDPRIVAAALQALNELGLAEHYYVSSTSVDENGHWCASLEPKIELDAAISACIDGGGSDLTRNVDLFKDKISRLLGLRQA